MKSINKFDINIFISQAKYKNNLSHNYIFDEWMNVLCCLKLREN